MYSGYVSRMARIICKFTMTGLKMQMAAGFFRLVPTNCFFQFVTFPTPDAQAGLSESYQMPLCLCFFKYWIFKKCL